MAVFAVKIPETDWEFLAFEAFEAELVDTFLDSIDIAFDGGTGKVTFNVGEENRYASIGEAFGHYFEGNSFAGATSARDESVAVGHIGED